MILSASRPARLISSEQDLDGEYRAARWLYHRLLDFEDRHQQHLDDVQEQVAPGMARVGRIVARLHRRVKRSKRSTGWSPPLHTAWLVSLQKRLGELRKQRNATEEWKAALRWDRDPEGPPVPRLWGKAPSPRDRRQHYRVAVLADQHVTERSCRARGEKPKVYWGTWQGLQKQADQARAAVLQARRAGLPAEWRRPRWDDPNTLYAEAGGFLVVERGKPWWVVEVRLAAGRWASFRAKLGNWHEVPDGAELKTCKVTRRRCGNRWEYSISIAVAGMPDRVSRGSGMVALDWGHREHGHPREHEGIRVFTWVGDDGASGEVILPRECRELLDKRGELLSRIDVAFNALGVPERNRHRYRSRLSRSGVRTAAEDQWLRWERRQQSRADRINKRVENVRLETYQSAVRDLARRYAVLVMEDEKGERMKQVQIEDEMMRRKRQNRDLSARYLFKSLCERSGALVVTVSARNTTRECPSCGHVGENTAELMTVCPACGVLRDKDYGAATIILRRGQEALANHVASA